MSMINKNLLDNIYKVTKDFKVVERLFNSFSFMEQIEDLEIVKQNSKGILLKDKTREMLIELKVIKDKIVINAFSKESNEETLAYLKGVTVGYGIVERIGEKVKTEQVNYSIVLKVDSIYNSETFGIGYNYCLDSFRESKSTLEKDGIVENSSIEKYVWKSEEKEDFQKYNEFFGKVKFENCLSVFEFLTSGYDDCVVEVYKEYDIGDYTTILGTGEFENVSLEDNLLMYPLKYEIILDAPSCFEEDTEGLSPSLISEDLKEVSKYFKVLSDIYKEEEDKVRNAHEEEIKARLKALKI